MTRTIITLILSILLVVPVALPQKRTQSFWDRVWKFFGVSATSGDQKGGEDLIRTRVDDFGIYEGNLWIYTVSTKVGVELTQASFRSPVFLPNEPAILALTGERVVKIPLNNGPLTDVASVPGIQKLVKIQDDAPDQALILTDLDRDNCPAVGVLSLSDGTVTSLVHEGREEDIALISYLRGWQREYVDETRLEIKTKTKDNGARKEWTDVWLKLKNKDSVNVSRCDGVNCGQPAVSNDRGLVVFVRAK